VSKNWITLSRIRVRAQQQRLLPLQGLKCSNLRKILFVTLIFGRVQSTCRLA